MREEVIPILRVKDAKRATKWYERLGFSKQWEHRFEEDLPAFVSVARGDLRIYLSEHEGDARPDTLLYLWIEDVGVVAKEFGETIKEVPWAREVYLKDPDGNRLRVASESR